MKDNIILLALAALCSGLALVTGLLGSDTGPSQILGPLQTILLVIFVIWHGTKLYGFKGIAIFFVISQVVSNVMENLSISTGFPFGDYHYSQGGLPFLFQVPFVIGIAYFAYGYLAWILANIILDAIGSQARLLVRTLFVPLTAAFAMVMWDVAMDPINSTIKHYWIWETGGGFNGVPLTNYLGWFLTVYLFYQIFALYLRVSGGRLEQRAGKVFWATPIMIYGATGLSFALAYVVASAGGVVDAAGYVWDKRFIYETAAVVSLFTMVFVSYLAMVKLLNTPHTQPKR